MTKLSDLKINPALMRKANRENEIREFLDSVFYAKPNYKKELQMLKYQYDNEQEERVGLHASSISDGSRGKGYCAREHILSMFYHRNDELKHRTYPPKLMRIFEEGKSIGTKWQRLFIRADIGEKEDMDVTRFHNEYFLYYTPDAIIEIDGVKYVVEIKSMNNNQYTKSNGHKKGEKQLKLYLHFEGIKQGFVLMENKDTQEFKISYVELKDNDEDIAEILYTLDDLIYAREQTLEKNRPPARHSDCTMYGCKKAANCAMSNACWGIERRKLDD